MKAHKNLLLLNVTVVIFIFLITSCISNSYVNTKVTAPVFKGDKKFIGTTYLGFQRTELNMGYKPFKKAYAVGAMSWIYFGGLSTEIGAGVIPINTKSISWNLHGSYGYSFLNRSFSQAYIPMSYTSSYDELKASYDKLSTTTYISLNSGKKKIFSLGARYNWSYYRNFYQTSMSSEDPPRSTYTNPVTYDTVSFRYKSFQTLDPFFNVNVKITDNISINGQILYSFHTPINVIGKEHVIVTRSNPSDKTYDKNFTLPNYKKMLLNIGLQVMF